MLHAKTLLPRLTLATAMVATLAWLIPDPVEARGGRGGGVRAGGSGSISRGGGGGFSRGGGASFSRGGGSYSRGGSLAASRPSSGVNRGSFGGSASRGDFGSRPSTVDRGGGSRRADAGTNRTDRSANRTDRANNRGENRADRTENRGENRGDRLENRPDRGNNTINSGNVSNINIDNDGGWGNWDDGIYHPIAAGVALGTAAAVTAAAWGSVYYSLPPGCSPYAWSGYSYYSCGGAYYQPQYEGDTVVYVSVPDPKESPPSSQPSQSPPTPP